MLPAKVQEVIKIYQKYWTDKSSSYVETCDSVDMLEAGLALQARSQGPFLNFQIDMKRLQRLNKESGQKVANVEIEAKRLIAEASTADEVIKAFKSEAC